MITWNKSSPESTLLVTTHTSQATNRWGGNIHLRTCVQRKLLLIDSAVTLPVSTRVLTGRVTVLSISRCCVQDHSPCIIPCHRIFPGWLFVGIAGIFVSGGDGTWGMIWRVIGVVGLAGNVGICVCWLHHPNDRHFCLSPTCCECWLNTSATFCYVGQYFGCQCCVGEFCCWHNFLHVSRNQH